MNWSLALASACRQHTGRASLLQHCASERSLQQRVSHELGHVPAARSCLDPDVEKGPGMCPRMSPAAGNLVLGGGSPHCHQQTQVVPSPREGTADVHLGVQLWGALWGLCLRGSPHLLLPSSLSLLLCCCCSCVPCSPHVMPSPQWKQPASPSASAWTATSPSPFSHSQGHVGSMIQIYPSLWRIWGIFGC